jgi:hypothetical protein
LRDPNEDTTVEKETSAQQSEFAVLANPLPDGQRRISLEAV